MAVAAGFLPKGTVIVPMFVTVNAAPRPGVSVDALRLETLARVKRAIDTDLGSRGHAAASLGMISLMPLAAADTPRPEAGDVSRPALSLPSSDVDAVCDVCGVDPLRCQCPECPECGVQGDPACYTTHGLDYADEERHDLRLWAVYPEMADSPTALFPDREVAEGWADAAEARGDLSQGWFVGRADAHLRIWNSTAPDPRAAGFASFTPDED